MMTVKSFVSGVCVSMMCLSLSAPALAIGDVASDDSSSSSGVWVVTPSVDKGGYIFIDMTCGLMESLDGFKSVEKDVNCVNGETIVGPAVSDTTIEDLDDDGVDEDVSNVPNSMPDVVEKLEDTKEVELPDEDVKVSEVEKPEKPKDKQTDFDVVKESQNISSNSTKLISAYFKVLGKENKEPNDDLLVLLSTLMLLDSEKSKTFVENNTDFGVWLEANNELVKQNMTKDLDSDIGNLAKVVEDEGIGNVRVVNKIVESYDKIKTTMEA